MQLIDITAGPIERYLKINKIKMHTAAATTDAEIVAIDSTIAATLKDSLSSKTKAHLQGI
jgi:membrane protein YdbS with pleckstrin-like domain